MKYFPSLECFDWHHKKVPRDLGISYLGKWHRRSKKFTEGFTVEPQCQQAMISLCLLFALTQLRAIEPFWLTGTVIHHLAPVVLGR